MKFQKDIFKKSEGNRWYERNKQAYQDEKEDFVVKMMRSIDIKPTKALEVGCSQGHRLNQIYKHFGCLCHGIDPSTDAIRDGNKKYPHLNLSVGTADSLPFENHSFDTIIFGFCLYFCDRDDLFKIAFEADRCLQHRGYLIVYDFFPPFPYKNTYSHSKRVFTYKMDYSKMFTWNPSYQVIYNTVLTHSGFSLREVPDEKLSITILNKNHEHAYPLEPFMHSRKISIA